MADDESVPEHGAVDPGAGVVMVTIGAANDRPLIRHGYWHLLRSMTRQQLQIRYQQSSLHLAWTIVQPLAVFGVYALFFNGILDVDGDNLPYLSFIIAGLVPWRFFANGLGGVSSLTDNVHVISKVYFPREIVPMVTCATGVVDLAVGTVALVVVAWVQGIPPDYHLVALPLVYVLLVLVTVAITIVATTVAVFVRDLAHGMPMVLLGLFLAAPIMYPVSRVPEWMRWLVDVNPLAVTVLSLRAIAVEQTWPDFAVLLPHLAASVLLVLGAISYLRSVEHRMLDIA